MISPAKADIAPHQVDIYRAKAGFGEIAGNVICGLVIT
jgi:hypothetical protein